MRIKLGYLRYIIFVSNNFLQCFWFFLLFLITNLKANSLSCEIILNRQSPLSDQWHLHPNAITRLSRQQHFCPHFYLIGRQQNIKTKTSWSSNQNDWYNDSEFCNGGKNPGLFMVSNRSTHILTGSLPEEIPHEKCPYSVFFWSVFSRIWTNI